MRAMASLALAGALLSLSVSVDRASGAGGTSEFNHVRLAQQALEKHIRPGYQRLAEAMKGLDAAVSAHCGGDAAGSRRKVDEAFDTVVSAWGGVDHITFGPVTAEQRTERIMFWPDRRGIGARQMAKILRERPVDVLDAKRLAEKSVAVQGLPALEELLFGGTSGNSAVDEAARFRCRFASAVASNLATIARSIADEWSSPDGFAKLWLDPGHDNPTFLKPEETTMALAKALDVGLEKVRDQRLAGPLGLTVQRRKMAPVLGKSRRSMRLIVANIEGLRHLYAEGGLEEALIDSKSDDPGNTKNLAQQVGAELATAEKSATELVRAKSPFEGASAQRIIALGFPLKNARVTAGELLTSVTNLPLGFNASDGD
ncbi:MAG: imelysin family protein [Hyphomicrobiaceae bacterium]